MPACSQLKCCSSAELEPRVPGARHRGAFSSRHAIPASYSKQARDGAASPVESDLSMRHYSCCLTTLADSSLARRSWLATPEVVVRPGFMQGHSPGARLGETHKGLLSAGKHALVKAPSRVVRSHLFRIREEQPDLRRFECTLKDVIDRSSSTPDSAFQTLLRLSSGLETPQPMPQTFEEEGPRCLGHMRTRFKRGH